MKGTMRVLLATLALFVLVAAPSAQALTMSDRDALEAALVTRINQVRKGHGLRPLRVVPRLANAAARHADSMGAASYFRHELFTPRSSVDWTSFARWIRWYYPGPGYTSWSAGENLAWGAPGITARRTVSRWLASSGHRANLLSRSWRHLGVAAVHVHDPRGVYSSWDDVTIVVAEFGRRA
jgi:uncharacterized protein YkwD